MFLIDALYINNSGGLELLKYLVKRLEQISADVYYLFDVRCPNHFFEVSDSKKWILKASLLNRKQFYQKYGSKFDVVFCFANIPPPIRLNSKVYTYFHNINLVQIPSASNVKTHFLSLLKKKYIISKKNNTDFWIVQTNHMSNVLSDEIGVDFTDIIQYPFYNIDFRFGKDNLLRDGYVYIANYTYAKNHSFLLDAWGELFDKGHDLLLKLTLSDIPRGLKGQIKKCIDKGVRIKNYGTVPKDEIWNLYIESKATVYPSINESFGLGIVEALSLGCDIIGPDLPYIHSICIPSELFLLEDVESLVSAIIKYESGELSHSKLLVRDQINELIAVLINEKL
jgi:glycosyltransferase involved in cell wall biosynthesis